MVDISICLSLRDTFDPTRSSRCWPSLPHRIFRMMRDAKMAKAPQIYFAPVSDIGAWHFTLRDVNGTRARWAELVEKSVGCSCGVSKKDRIKKIWNKVNRRVQRTDALRIFVCPLLRVVVRKETYSLLNKRNHIARGGKPRDSRGLQKRFSGIFQSAPRAAKL